MNKTWLFVATFLSLDLLFIDPCDVHSFVETIPQTVGALSLAGLFVHAFRSGS